MPIGPAGALLVDKGEGLTSHDVVAVVRRLAREKRCGHTGTLDPFATGLLVLCLGRATRLTRFVTGLDKSYLATVRFGFATDTYDRTGRAEPGGADPPGREELGHALESFQGEQEQCPPPFSAKKVSGVRAYRLARAGLDVRPAPVRVRIDELELLDYSPPLARLRATVSSGTYVRSLAHDLGRKLGCGAHLEALRRTRIGSLSVEQAETLEALEAAASRGRLTEHFLSPARILQDLPAEVLSAEEAERFVHGRPLSRPAARSGPLRILGPKGDLLGVAQPVGDGGSDLRSLVVWASPEA